MNYYTYLWLREDGSPYYVGKGKDRRAFRRGCPPRSRIVLQEYSSESDAFEQEKRLIAQYGRKDNNTGILRNLTDGGEGLANASEEIRQKMSASHTGVKLSEHHRLRQSEGRRGQRHSTQHALNISKSKLGHPVSAETREKIGAVHRGKPWSSARRLAQGSNR